MTTSVIVAVYNGLPYIEEQLDSIRMQTIAADQVLVSDDGSKDESCTFILNYIEKYDLLNWKLIQRKENLGWKKNFIETMKLATGDIIFLADQDDIWLPNKIERYIEAFEQNNRIKVLASNYTIFYDSTNQEQQKFNRQVKQMVNDGNVMRQTVTKAFHITDRPGCVYATQKAFFDEVVHCYAEDHPHDSFLWLTANSVGGLYIIQESFIKYRRHSENANRKKSLSNIKLEDRIAFTKRERMIVTLLKENGMETDLSKIEKRNIELFEKFCELRLSFFETKKIMKWICLCLFYRGFYSSWKSVFADFVITIKEGVF